MDQDGLDAVKQANIGASKMDNDMELNDGWQMDDDWNQFFKMMDNVRFASQLDKAHCALEPLPGSPPNHINQSETVRKSEPASSERLVRSSTTPNHINQSLYLSHNRMERINKRHNETGKTVRNSEMEKSRAWNSSFGGIDSTLCTFNRPFKDNTQSFYQSSSYANHVSHANTANNRNSRTETESLMQENSQRNRNVEPNFTRGTSRCETYNCPSHTTACFRPFKDTTKSYSYSTSSEDESERIERKEKERYERKLIREHLKQKSKDQSYEYCLDSFEYAGQNLADTDETEGGITLSDWSEPEPEEGDEENEIFVGYFEDSEALQKMTSHIQMIQDLRSQSEFTATWDSQIESRLSCLSNEQRFQFHRERPKEKD